VAGRLAEERARPAIVYQKGEPFSTGSARSVAAFNIHTALEQGAHLLERFGGHDQAGGFSVRTERLAELRRVLTEWAGGQRDWDGFVPEIDIDMELPVEQTLPQKQMRGLVRQLEPCGPSNPAPLFLGRHALVLETRRMGPEGRSLRLRLSDGHARRGWSAVAFGMGEHAPRPGTRIDLVYSVEDAKYGDAELHIADFAPSEA
jgi:single-stranded-DNA-specific exonuclease